MSEPFIGEIRIWPYNFAPRGWAFCDGQLLPIANNTALFSIIGTIYGGDGRSTFALPNLQGRVPIHAGRGPGLSNRTIGQRMGIREVVLNTTQLPNHSHDLQVLSTVGDATVAQGNVLAQSFSVNAPVNTLYASSPDATTSLASSSITHIGGGQFHNNVMPTLGLGFCIALQGLFPSRS